MLLTRIKKKQSAIKNGVYNSSILNIVEGLESITINFKASGQVIPLALPKTKESLLKLGQIAYLGGIKEKEDVSLSSLVNLNLKISVIAGKVVKIQ